MEERIKVTSIIKSNNPEELIVFHAESLDNEIRFYLNDTQYITAIECEEDSFSIKLGEEKAKKVECDKKSKISIIMEHYKEFIKLFAIPIGILILSFIGMLYLGNIINNIISFVIIINITYFIVNIMNVIVIEFMQLSPTIKSKHSAEHMMVNFLETNKRLPKNLEEVKNSSRFSSKCGSRKLIYGISEDLIRSILATIFAGTISVLFSSNYEINAVIFLFTYFFIGFIIRKLMKKYELLSFIIHPIKKVLTNIAQCANTTNKVKDKDIILSYFVASVWLQVVYPEFYDKNTSTFWKQYLKEVNN